jgi:hypothetical protein
MSLYVLDLRRILSEVLELAEYEHLVSISEIYGERLQTERAMVAMLQMKKFDIDKLKRAHAGAGR